MKKLTIEEKAQRYDMALDNAKYYHNAMGDDICCVLEECFPELKENEDEGERIRKAISQCVEDMRGQFEKLYSVHHKDAIAWLEKQGEHANFLSKIQIGDKVTRNGAGMLVNLSQLNRVAKPSDEVKPKFKHGDRVRNKKSGLEQTLGSCIEDVYEGAFPFRIKDQDDWELVEQKPADKAEPKFKVGDWVMLDRPVLITKVEDMPYNTHQYWTSDGTWFGDATKAKLWTIQDAKDGDVLATNSFLYIFKYTNNKAIIQFHCMCPINGKPYKWSFSHNDSYLDIYTDANIHPATKEQRDTLMKAMTDAGYTFDFEKKELKKIESNHAWSEEDEQNFNEALSYIKDDALKEFIKSLRLQKQWKPLGKHLVALAMAINDEPLDISVRDDLNELFEQLKQL